MGRIVVRTKTPTFAEVAEAMRNNRTLVDVTTADVREAAKARGVKVREGRVQNVGGSEIASIYFALMNARGVDTVGPCGHRSPLNYNYTRWATCTKPQGHPEQQHGDGTYVWTNRTMACKGAVR